MADRTGKHRPVPVIGVTGQIGAGKSLVAALFASWGGVVISGDEVGHEVTARSGRLRQKLSTVFGSGVLQGIRIDRARLAERAFANAEAARQLNALIHPPLLVELNRQVRRARRLPRVKAVIIDAALLPEWGHKAVPWDALVGVWAPLHLRRARLRARGWSEEEIRRRSRCQLPWSKRRAFCDYVVKNDGSRAVLRRRAQLCWRKVVS